MSVFAHLHVLQHRPVAMIVRSVAGPVIARLRRLEAMVVVARKRREDALRLRVWTNISAGRLPHRLLR